MKGKLKQNSKKKKTNAVLQKCLVAVDDFIKSKSGTGELDNDHGIRFVKRKSRKELRKEKRKMKKAKMKSHYEGNKTLSLPYDDGKKKGIPAEKLPTQKKKNREESSAHSSKSTSDHAEKKKDDTKILSTSRKRKKTNKLQESRKMALLEANEDEDREIKKLERCLGLNKRKNKKSIPQSFVADGLDYILGVLDSGSSAVGMQDDDDDMEMAKENFEKLDENDNGISEDEVASEGSNEDTSLFDENESDDGVIEDEDEIVDENDATDSNVEHEVEAEQEADQPEANKSCLQSETVSSEILYY